MCSGSISLVGYDSKVRSLETVHRPRYFRFCNVLHIWTIRAIPTYRVYRLYDIGISPGNHNLSYKIYKQGKDTKMRQLQHNNNSNNSIHVR